MIADKLFSVGDVNPIDHGGGFVFRNEHGAFLEYVDEPDDDDDDARSVTIYSCSVPECGEELLRDLDWVDVSEIERFTGCDIGLKSRSGRAGFILDVASYHGWINLDQYPLTMTVAQLRERWWLT